MRATRPIGLACLTLTLASCATVEVKPIKIEPIYMIVDVNIRVDRQLEDFFQDLREPAETQPPPPATAPAPAAPPAITDTETPPES